MTIGERIIEIMQQKGITQTELSSKTGIPQSTISEWKRKKLNPSADKILLISNALNISPNELLQENSKNEKIDYYIVTKGTEKASLIETYDVLDSNSRERLMGYAEALAHRYK